MSEATISVEPAAPKYGDKITLTATVSGSGGKKSRISGRYVHDGGTSVSYSPYHAGDGTYSDDVGLYAPNWPSGAAHAFIICELLVKSTRSGKQFWDVIGTLEFEVAA